MASLSEQRRVMTAKATRYLALVMSVLLMASIAIPGAVAGAAVSNDDLTLEVVQDKDTGNVTITVAVNDSAVENATVNVTSEAEYAGIGSYSTDQDGTLELPEPNQTVSVNILAQANNTSVVGDFELVPRSKSLEVQITQDSEDGISGKVTQYGDVVENATVNISTADGNETYDGSGEYTTDENGSFELPVPDTGVEIEAVASYNELTNSTTIQLAGAELAISVDQTEGDVLIEVMFGNEPAVGANVTVEGDYKYAGTKTTDESGTVEFPAPLNDTSVNITGDFQNHTKTIPVDLEARNDTNPNNDFAQSLVAFIHHLTFGEIDGPPGQVISEFVHENNPSSADDNAGPPDHAGPPDNAGPKNETLNATEQNATNEQGPPPWAGPPENKTNENKNKTKEPGPPDDKGP